MADEIDLEKYRIEESEDGLLQVICKESGEVVKLLQNPDDKPEQLVPVTRSDGTEIFVHPDIHPDAIDSCLGAKRFVFSWPLAQVICNEIMNGAPITRLGDLGLPSYSVITSWRKSNDKFDEMIRQAERDRADEYHARAMEQAETITDKDEVSINNLKFQIYKWGAEKDHPDKYGPRSKVETDHGPVKIYLNTGIIRKPFKDVEETQEAIDGKTEAKVHVLGPSANTDGGGDG